MQLLCIPKPEGIFCEAVAMIYRWWVTHSSWDDSNRKKAKKIFSHIKINVRILFCRDREEIWEKLQKIKGQCWQEWGCFRIFSPCLPIRTGRCGLWELTLASNASTLPILSSSPCSPWGTGRQHQQEKASACPLSRFSCLPSSEINKSIWTLIPGSSVPVCLHCSLASLPVELCYWN